MMEEFSTHEMIIPLGIEKLQLPSTVRSAEMS